ncbi:MAG TPA: HAD-IA family hydrolase [Terracidiphilus sp.]|nr:HAD-IA family hydrolase [Terracidiphilus sp.]
MFPFDVILFDVGGVLLTNGWDRRERAAAAVHFAIDPEPFERRHLSIVDAWERDEVHLDTYLDTAVFFEPRSFSREDFFAFMLSQSQVLPDGALGILNELAASNRCMLGTLNNEARETNEYRFKKFGLRRYLKIALSSCFVGLRKPEPAIYGRAIDILGAPPGRILFIDDRQENVAGAAAEGIRAIQFTGEDALRRELQGLGVLQIERDFSEIATKE